ncbi:MAG TPA: hypothetical protein VFO85_22240 [Vicinamibacteria bacterium]|nr:hypothetical protein [Vicinamibacteria bacterium]
MGACAVSDREALVGRYVVEGSGETWVLRDDGACTIARGGAVIPCEWEYRQQDDEGPRVVVTVAEGGPGAARHLRRYVLAPRRVPGRPVMMPLSRSATLVKREDGPGAAATP